MAIAQCRYCQRDFTPSPYRPAQQVCCADACQRRRKADYHRKHKADNPVYAETCRDAQRHWREANADYQRQYRESHPEQRRRNRELQSMRDARRKIARLVKNNLASDVTASISQVFLVGPAVGLLDKNILAQSKLLICQPLAVPIPLLQRTT